MKASNPKDRQHLNIKKTDYVLEVGGGHNPHPRSNMVVDKYTDSNYHRSGDIVVRKNQKFMQADGENLPFADNEFDYVICNQVLEHVEDPIKFLAEQSRVAKRGFIETPSLIGEYLFPKESHKWVLLELKNQLVMVEKSKINLNPVVNFGDLFLDFLPKQSIAFKLLQRTYMDLFTVRYEWEGEIDYVINPEDEELIQFFTRPWENDLINQFFVKKSLGLEAMETLAAAFDVVKTYSKTVLARV